MTGSDSKEFDPEVRDRKGRRVSTVVSIATIVLSKKPADAGWGYTIGHVPASLRAAAEAGEEVTFYEVESNAQRDGKKYGAIPRSTRYATIVEAEKAREKSGRAAIKRNQKVFGGVS